MQNARVVPSLSRDGQTTFHEIARELANPCVESDLTPYKTLDDLLSAGKTCREAWLMTSDMAFYLQNAVESRYIQAIMRTQQRYFAHPAKVTTQNRPRLGSESAPVEVVVFSDFQCPFCARAAQVVHRIHEARPDDVSFVFKQMPLTSIHPYAAAAALVSAYAHEQGRFWEVHDALFENQKSIDSAMLSSLIVELGTTPEELFSEENGEKYGVTVIEDMQEAVQSGIEGTPSFMIGGVFIEGGANYERLMTRIDAELRAPEPVSERERQEAHQKALQHCPYPSLEEHYGLLTPADRADLRLYTDSVLCPCSGSMKTLHECAADDSCPRAKAIVESVMTQMMEETPQAQILDELNRQIQAARANASEE